MADFRIEQAPFGVGTTVGVYRLRADWRIAAGVDPGATAVTTAVVDSTGTVLFTGLADDERYAAAALIGSTWKYVKFNTPPIPSEVTINPSSGSPSGTAGGVLAGNYPNPTFAPGSIVYTDLVGTLTDPAPASAGLRTLGTGPNQAAAGDDSRFTSSAKTIEVMRTYTLPGAIAIATGETDFLPSFGVVVRSGQTLKLLSASTAIHSGTQVGFKITNNGSDLTGYGTDASPLLMSTSPSTTTSTQTLATSDRLAVVVISVSGSPQNGYVDFRFEVGNI